MIKNTFQTYLRSLHSTILKVALLSISSILVLGSCTEDLLTANQDLLGGGSYFGQSYVDDGFTRENALATLDSGGTAGIYYGEGLISGLNGGALNIDMIGNVLQFNVPSNAMDTSKWIYIGVSMSIYNGAIHARLDCGPDGLQFNKSSVFSFPISALGNNKSSIDLYLLDSSGKWIIQGTYKADANGMVSLPIDHFSMYGVE